MNCLRLRSAGGPQALPKLSPMTFHNMVAFEALSLGIAPA